MRKKTRLIITIALAILFFVITPFLVLYSMGYIVDLTHGKIVAKGGIYVKALPIGATITIDYKTSNTTNLLYPSVFVQNLLPKNHTVSIAKDGYFNYQKNLEVKENEVTKLEKVILFKKSLLFNVLTQQLDYFSIAPDGTILLTASLTDSGKIINIQITNLNNMKKQSFSLPFTKETKINDPIWDKNNGRFLIKIGNSIYLIDFSPPEITATAMDFLNGTKSFAFYPSNGKVIYQKNQNLYLQGNSLPIAKNILAYNASGQNIYWLDNKGFLFRTGPDNLPAKLNIEPFSLNGNNHQIFILESQIFFQEGSTLSAFNQNTQSLEKIYDSVEKIKDSPDQRKVLYYNSHEIFYHVPKPDVLKEQKNVSLHKTSDQIKNCDWVNNDYILCNIADKISVLETDPRGNINIVSFPDISLSDNSSVALRNPQIFFNSNDKKIYILNQNNLLASERLIP